MFNAYCNQCDDRMATQTEGSWGFWDAEEWGWRHQDETGHWDYSITVESA